ncbi:hypothetical protein GJ496_001354 [Pomphorhynchus laevis]|nr:hypothetical protein GJ496_001354 [Pomphorhynchus laevis]
MQHITLFVVLVTCYRIEFTYAEDGDEAANTPTIEVNEHLLQPNISNNLNFSKRSLPRTNHVQSQLYNNAAFRFSDNSVRNTDDIKPIIRLPSIYSDKSHMQKMAPLLVHHNNEQPQFTDKLTENQAEQSNIGLERSRADRPIIVKAEEQTDKSFQTTIAPEQRKDIYNPEEYWHSPLYYGMQPRVVNNVNEQLSSTYNTGRHPHNLKQNIDYNQAQPSQYYKGFGDEFQRIVINDKSNAGKEDLRNEYSDYRNAYAGIPDNMNDYYPLPSSFINDDQVKDDLSKQDPEMLIKQSFEEQLQHPVKMDINEQRLEQFNKPSGQLYRKEPLRLSEFTHPKFEQLPFNAEEKATFAEPQSKQLQNTQISSQYEFPTAEKQVDYDGALKQLHTDPKSIANEFGYRYPAVDQVKYNNDTGAINPQKYESSRINQVDFSDHMEKPYSYYNDQIQKQLLKNAEGDDSKVYDHTIENIKAEDRNTIMSPPYLPQQNKEQTNEQFPTTIVEEMYLPMTSEESVPTFETLYPDDFSEDNIQSTDKTVDNDYYRVSGSSNFDESDFENCEYNEYDMAPMFADKRNPSMYITCASYGVPIRLPCAPSTFFNDALKACVPEGFIDSSCGSRCANGECIFSPQKSKHVCRCNMGYSGVNCTEKIDYCREFGHNCGSGKCINQVGTYVCDCGHGLVGQSCNNAVTVPCSTQFVHEGGRLDKRTYHPFGTNHTAYITCFTKDSFVVRRCKDGQYWDQSALACVNNKPREVKPGCEQYPCLSGGQCVSDSDSSDKYKCICTPGYYGKNCEYAVDHCKPNPCAGHPCVSTANPPGYYCECPNKIHDDCCCNNIENRCSNVKNGGFYAEKDGMFVHCTPDGRAFVKRCPKGFGFDEQKLTCERYYKIRGKPLETQRYPFQNHNEAVVKRDYQLNENELQQTLENQEQQKYSDDLEEDIPSTTFLPIIN